MGLFDQVVSGLAGNLAGGGAQSKLLESVVGLINNPETGGLTGLVQAFKEKGLGDAVTSWISTGENKPISGEQIQHVLGPEQIQQIAGKLGASSAEVSSGLAGLLPQIIDHLTPNGTLPDSGLLEQGLSMLARKFLTT